MTTHACRAILAFALALAPGLAHAQTAQAAQEPQGPLHDRARRAGGHLTEKLTGEPQSVFATIGELAARAPVIVIGQVLAARSHLSDDRKRLTSDFVFKVQEPVKGDVKPGAHITVSVPGGSHRFADGSTVKQYRPGYRPMQEGGRYLLFLHESPSRRITRNAVVFELAAGSQGQFELDFEANAVKPGVGERAHPLAARYQRVDILALLSELHEAVPRAR